jgi:hypothetical protein
MTDFTRVLKDFDGRDLVDPKAITDGKEARQTLGRICCFALLQPESGIPGSNGNFEDQFKRYALADRIKTNPQCALDAEEITLLKERIARFNVPLITGQCIELLDPGYAAKMFGASTTLPSVGVPQQFSQGASTQGNRRATA